MIYRAVLDVLVIIWAVEVPLCLPMPRRPPAILREDLDTIVAIVVSKLSLSDSFGKEWLASCSALCALPHDAVDLADLAPATNKSKLESVRAALRTWRYARRNMRGAPAKEYAWKNWPQRSPTESDLIRMGRIIS